MSDTERSRPLLARLAWRFHPRTEEVAVEALAYILNRYPASRGGLNELLRKMVPELRLSDGPFRTEVSASDGTKPDVVQTGVDGEERLFIEAKFHASLTPNQPVPYLQRLPDDGVSALMFLAPSWRLKDLRAQLLYRVDKAGMTASTEGPWCATVDGTQKHLLVTDWTTLLNNMEARLASSEEGLADVRQLIGLTRFAETNTPKSPHAGEALVNQVVAIGRSAGWINQDGLNATPKPYGYGRYVRLGRRARLGVWVGFNTNLHEEFKDTPLWIWATRWKPPSDSGWTERTIPTLKERFSPYTKQVGKGLWVGVVPEEPADPDSYAEELERIAEIADAASESRLSRAAVLREVGRRYDRPVMNNVHRAEYVEGLVALALRDSGWMRKEPWEAWHFENESGVRLKLKHSAAVQSWEKGVAQDSPRFDIAPGKGYWDDEAGRWVESPGRHAEVYVFAWHGSSGETTDQRDPTSWEFYVVPERDLPEQKSIGLPAVRDLTSPCRIRDLATTVVSVVDSGPCPFLN